MNQALADIALNSIYRTCFKYAKNSHESTLSDADKQTFANCFNRLVQAYRIVAPTVFRQLEEETIEMEKSQEKK